MGGVGRRHGKEWGGDMGRVGRRYGWRWGGDMGGLGRRQGKEWGGDMGRGWEEIWVEVGRRYVWGWGGDMGGDGRGRREDIFMSFNNETVIPHRSCWLQYPGCPTEGAKPHRTALRTVGLGRSVHKITGQGAWQVTLYSEFVGRGICRSDGVLGVRNRAHPCPLECPMLRRGHTHY